MEAAVWIISVCMAAFGPAVFSVVAGNICGRRLERVSRKLGGWTGLVMGIAAVYAPLAKPKLFIAIWVGGLTSDESWARFHTVTAIVIAVAVTMTCAACFGVNRYREGSTVTGSGTGGRANQTWLELFLLEDLKGNHPLKGL